MWETTLSALSWVRRKSPPACVVSFVLICEVALAPWPVAAQITGTCCGKSIQLSNKGSGFDRCFDCKTFMQSGATSWPPAEACTSSGMLSYAMRCGVILDCSQKDEQNLREAICTQLREQDPAGSAEPDYHWNWIPDCVQDALKEVLSDYLKAPEINYEVNLSKVTVRKGSKLSTETDIYLDAPGADLVLKRPCARPFVLYVGMQIQRLRMRREMEWANRQRPGTFTDEQIRNGIPAVQESERAKLMGDIDAYFRQHAPDDELTCCKPPEMPTPKPGRPPVSCPDVEPYCQPRIGLLMCPER